MISIITPVYNGERFIESCVRVVIDQACPHVEHIIVDGGSTDRTLDTIKQYAEKYPHIRWISEKDQGQSDAMNKGILMAIGEIMTILNVDDFYEPNVLRRILEIFKTLPTPSLLVGNCNVWNDEGKLDFLNKPVKLKLNDLLLAPYKNSFPMNPSAYFYHTLLHQKVGLYKVDEHYVMDYDFLLKAVQAATVVYLDETWGNYRLIEGTKTINDEKSGQSLQRLELLIENYRSKLFLTQRWQLALLRKAYKNLSKTDDILDRIRYYSNNPKEVLPNLKNKLMRYLT